MCLLPPSCAHAIRVRLSFPGHAVRSAFTSFLFPSPSLFTPLRVFAPAAPAQRGDPRVSLNFRLLSFPPKLFPVTYLPFFKPRFRTTAITALFFFFLFTELRDSSPLVGSAPPPPIPLASSLDDARLFFYSPATNSPLLSCGTATYQSFFSFRAINTGVSRGSPRFFSTLPGVGNSCSGFRPPHCPRVARPLRPHETFPEAPRSFHFRPVGLVALSFSFQSRFYVPPP